MQRFNASSPNRTALPAARAQFIARHDIAAALRERHEHLQLHAASKNLRLPFDDHFAGGWADAMAPSANFRLAREIDGFVLGVL